MTFTPNIPATGQSLGSSRTQVSNNFANYFNTISQDHVSPNSIGQGKHNKSTYPDQSADPVTIADEIASYGKSIAGTSELFLRPENAGTPIQMSRLDVGIAIGATNGWTFLPGGIIFQWGRGQFVGNATNATILFTTSNINFPNNCFNVSLTGIGCDNVFDVTAISQLQFVSSRSLGGLCANQQFFWMAIGN